MPLKKSRKRGAKQAEVPARKKRTVEKEDKDDEILESDSDEEPVSDGVAENDEDDDEVQESATERRLRLAKSILQQVKNEEKVRREDEDEDEDDPQGLVSSDERVATRLKNEMMEARGYRQRQVACKVVIPSGGIAETGTTRRAHSRPVTCLTLTSDDTTAYTASKDGAVFKWDVESGTKTKFCSGGDYMTYDGPSYPGSFAEPGPSSNGYAVLSCAVSSDGHFLATGGGDRVVHIYDTRTQKQIQAFPGHKDMITGLKFRDGTNQLYSVGLDRAVKIWSLDDMMYLDTLFGHQGEIMGVDCDNKERPITVSRDHTSRMWKIADETHLVFRGGGYSLDCITLMGGGAWVTGSDNGSLQLWQQMKKKPTMLVKGAHGESEESGLGIAAGWVQSLAAVKGGDLLASGAGDGCIRLWGLERDSTSMKELYEVPVRGFVNGLAFARSGEFLVAGIGQEPRMGRWARYAKARNGLFVHRVGLEE